MYLSAEMSAVVMGITEGLTEFLPVSSTGHLVLMQELIRFHADENNFFDVFIQLGAILAVVVLYWSRFTGFLNIGWRNLSLASARRRIREGKGFSGLTGIVKVGIACVPAFILGVLFYNTIKSYLMFPLPVSIALIVGGLLMIAIERKKGDQHTSVDDVSYSQAFYIGLIQCLSLWPGFSRSGATIIGGLVVGLKREAAAEFSFIVAVPVMVGAVLFDFIKSFSDLSMSHLNLFLIGFIVSFIVAIIAIKFMMALIKRYSFECFGYYRIALGLLVIGLVTF